MFEVYLSLQGKAPQESKGRRENVSREVRQIDETRQEEAGDK